MSLLMTASGGEAVPCGTESRCRHQASAHLRGARLRGARLWGARLRGALLRGERLRGERLRGAVAEKPFSICFPWR